MPKHRNIWGACVALLVCFLVYFTCSPLKYEPKGLFLPAPSYRALSPTKASDVQLFQSDLPFFRPYKTLGRITVEFYDPEASLKKKAELIEWLKQAAGKAGGNGVLLDRPIFNTTPYGGFANMNIWLAQAHVILY